MKISPIHNATIVESGFIRPQNERKKNVDLLEVCSAPIHKTGLGTGNLLVVITDVFEGDKDGNDIFL